MRSNKNLSSVYRCETVLEFICLVIKILFKIRLSSFFISDIALYYRSKENITGLLYYHMKDYSKTDYFPVKNDVTLQALHSKEIITDQERQLFRQNFTRDKKPYFVLKHADSFIIVIRHSDKTLLVYGIRIHCEL